MKFKPEAYAITIRKEAIDGEFLYVGRVHFTRSKPELKKYFNSGLRTPDGAPDK